VRSPLHQIHAGLGARFVDFGGWEMPVQYTSVLEEHMAVRRHVGWFDVSHLGRFSIVGSGATDRLMALLTNDAATLEPGRSQYTLMLDDGGGIVDDLIVWKWGDDEYWVLPNAANHERVMAAFAEGPASTRIADLRPSTVSLAVQGPDAPAIISQALGFAPKRFRTARGTFAGEDAWAAGTGYTGERGGEVVVPVGVAPTLVDRLVEAGAIPCGLAARDTLRLEAGLPLWGQDMDTSTSPLEVGLSFAVDLDHEFVGRAALVRQRDHGVPRRPVAFRTEGRKIPRRGMALRCGDDGGTVTSGNFSPVLECGIGIGLVDSPGDGPLELEIRGEWVPVERVQPPFHRLERAG
jgi:aminomethyltransferase